MHLLKESEGTSLLEIRVNVGARGDLGRPTTTPIENKEAFIKNFGSLKDIAIKKDSTHKNVRTL